MSDAVHWADIIAESISKENSKCLVAIGITLSGSINISSVREAVTADAIYKALLDRGIDADFICIADNFAPLHKVNPFLSKSYIGQMGKPISEIPCPCGTCANYAEHYLKPYLETLNRIGISPRVYRTDEMYRAGRYNETIEIALTNRDTIAKILEELSGKSVEPGWNPFNPICDKCGKITKTEVIGFNPVTKTIDYVCDCGHSGTVPVAGGGKLSRIIERPAIWAVLGIAIEVFGKDHAPRGDFYDIEKRISKEIFRLKAPHPVVCEQIMPAKHGTVNSHEKVTTTSAVTSVPASEQYADLLSVMPPEFLRYLIIRSKPQKQIYFNPGQAFLTLLEEYERLRMQFRGKKPSSGAFEKRIYEISRLADICQSEIPFRQMATIYQVARGNFSQILKIVRRAGYSSENEKCIEELVDSVSLWLELYAPPFVKFYIKETVPVQAATLSKLQKAFLAAFAALIETREKISAEEYHMLVYSAVEDGSELNKRFVERLKETVNLQGDSRDVTLKKDPRDLVLQTDPGDLFKAIYISLLGQNSGPRAGWFLSSFENEFLVKRFGEASTYFPGKR